MRYLLTSLLCLLVVAPAQAQEDDFDGWWVHQDAVEGDTLLQQGQGACAAPEHLDNPAAAQLLRRGNFYPKAVWPDTIVRVMNDPRARKVPPGMRETISGIQRHHRLLRSTSNECTVVGLDTKVAVEESQGEWLRVAAEDLIPLQMQSAFDIHQGFPDVEGGGGTPRPAARKTQARETTSGWQTLGSWSGQGSKTTRTFRVDSREWRIRWKAEPTSRVGGSFSIQVYSAGGDLVTLAANITGRGSDVSYVHAGPGRFYLEIGGANTSWKVQAQGQ